MKIKNFINGAEDTSKPVSIIDTGMIKFIVDNPERAKIFTENLIAKNAFSLLRQAAKLMGNLYQNDLPEQEIHLEAQFFQYLEICLEHAFSPKKALDKFTVASQKINLALYVLFDRRIVFNPIFKILL